MCAHKSFVRIFRKDSLSTPLEYQDVKHMWVQNGFLNLSMGEHEEGRHYALWPLDQIDHVLVEEEEAFSKEHKKIRARRTA